MNNPDFQKDRSSLQLLGKEFLIVVVVIFSALSFTLGYFVGKSSIDKKSDNPSQPAEILPAPQAPQKQGPAALPQAQNPTVAEDNSAPQTEETAKGSAQPRPKEPPVVVEVQKPGPVKSAQAAKEKSAAQLETQPEAKQLPKAPVRDQVKEQVRESGEKPGVKDNAASEKGGKPDEQVYTVQMGAFKSAAEAKSFSKKHAIKGTKTYITTSSGKNKSKIYKVRAGEFRHRKDAEILSVKLNKTSKIKTFVTLKGD